MRRTASTGLAERDVSVIVRIPRGLRQLTAGAEVLHASGATVGELIEDLERQHPGLKPRLCEPSGALKRYVNVYVGDEDIRFVSGLATKVEPGADVLIAGAISGGQSE